MAKMVIDPVNLNGIKYKTEYILELAQSDSVYVIYNIYDYIEKLFREKGLSYWPTYEHCWRLRPLSECVKDMNSIKMQDFIDRILYAGSASIVRIGWI